MDKKFQFFICVVFFEVVFLWKTNIYAAEDYRLSKADVKPFGEIKIQYDDNVFLDASNKKDDFITILTPGVSLEHPFGTHLFKLDYQIDIIKFFNYSSQDATNHYLAGEMDINWQDIRFVVYDRFAHVFERPSTEDISRVKREDNKTGIMATLERERLGIQLGYEHFIRNYKSDDTYEIFDRREDIYSFTLAHKTFQKADLLFEYDFGQIRYDEDVHPESDYHQFLIGVKGELTSKTTSTIKAGYQSRDYKGTGEAAFNTGVLYMDMRYRFSEKDALMLSFLRSANESTYSINNFYKVEDTSFTFSHFFNVRLLGFIAGTYQIHSYPEETTEGLETKKRKDKYYSIGTGLKYFIRKWFTLLLRFDHIVRDSNFDIFEYDQNLVTFTARVEF